MQDSMQHCTSLWFREPRVAATPALRAAEQEHSAALRHHLRQAVENFRRDSGCRHFFSHPFEVRIRTLRYGRKDHLWDIVGVETLDGLGESRDSPLVRLNHH
eukprot:GDKH01004135.1.p2 GENE.GDKH01004135.1~~GDKH01004135.1.p2  ORF type:complete len:102 (+),score=14.13 GDKH01004135.1:53-358(+)